MRLLQLAGCELVKHTAGVDVHLQQQQQQQQQQQKCHMLKKVAAAQ
jgi:hypothetical protein